MTGRCTERSRWRIALVIANLGLMGGCGDGDALGDSGASGDADVTAEVASDDAADARDDGDTSADVPDIVTHCLGPAGPASGEPGATASLADPLGIAAVTIAERAACHRSYTLTSTATRRDDLPTSPRVVDEVAGAPTVRSGNDLFDALHALALTEAREASVATIADGAFDQGRAQNCGAAGCFETGRKWTWVWTRDTSFAIDLGLAAIDAPRSRDSLLFKVSARRDVGAGGASADAREIVQDTGSGGSWPVSSDRVVWALGAQAVLDQLTGDARAAFRDAAWAALKGTLERDRAVVFDATTGLYRGEQSFLDWREQSYPGWTAQEVSDIAGGRALSTNCLHLRALEVAAALGDEVGDTARAATFRGWADELRAAIRGKLWLESDGQFGTFMPSYLDATPARRWDLLGTSLAILSGVATADQARRMLSGYPLYGPGAPVIWPQQQQLAIYHNRAEWPFVDAYALRAAALVGHDAMAARMVMALVRAAALNLSNMENLEAGTGAPWLDDGTASGPVINSQRQLWSVGGYLSMVHRTLFGLEATPTGLKLQPYVPKSLRASLFGESDKIVLNDWPYRGRTITVVLTLPPADALAGASGAGASLVAGTLSLNDRPLDAGHVISDGELAAENRIDVTLVGDGAAAATIDLRDDADWHQVFGPRTPAVTALEADAGHLRLTLATYDDDPAALRLDVYRDGARVATDLPGTTTTWTDGEFDATSARSPCYVVEAVFATGGNRSQRSRARCWWGAAAERIQVIDATHFVATGGTGVTEYDKFHYQGWGDPGHKLEILDVVAAQTGPHLFQVTYGNGAGPITTGIACGLKRLTVKEHDGGAIVADGALVMPQLGRWDRWALSGFVPAHLIAGRHYDVVIASDPGYANMSALSAFATYGGATGGSDGPFDRVNIADLRILAR